MISYPLQEYISSKKDDDYRQTISSFNSSAIERKTSPQISNSNRLIYIFLSVLVLIFISIFYSYYSYIDPTCFNKECTDFVCQAYSEGLIGGHLCPELCTTRSAQLQNCLGEHKHFRSRLFEDNQGNQVIRCYLRDPLSKSNPTKDLKDHFNFPKDEATFDQLYLAIEEHIQKMIQLENPNGLIEDLFKFADFNNDEKISLSEARSLWTLVQIDEFVYLILLQNKGYTPKVLGSCGHVFSLEKVINRALPFDEKQKLYSLSDQPNWYQRVRLAVGIVEFFSDTWHYQDTDEHLYLCQSLIKSFGYDKDYESKMLKNNHLISSKSLLSRLPNHCNSNKDCRYNIYCDGICNRTTQTCQMKEFNENSLNELCSLVSSLVTPDGNMTFLDNFNSLIRQCQQIITDANLLDHDYVDLTSLEIRQNLILQNIRNFLWTNIEYQLSKITKKPTKKPTAAPPIVVKKK